MIKYLSIIVLSFLIASPLLAGNTHTTDLDSASSQYWSITDANQTGLDFGTSFSLSWWEKTPDTSVKRGVFWKKGSATTGFAVTHNSNTAFYLAYYCTAGQTFFSYDPSSDISNNTWHHFTITCDTGVCDLYIDGVDKGISMTDTNCSAPDNSTYDFQLGISTTISAYNGNIDDVRIYSDVLTAQEIEDTYNCEMNTGGTYPDNLVAHWKFDNDGLDETANNNDLTNNNSATFQSTSLPFTADCYIEAEEPENPEEPTATTTEATSGTIPIYNDLTVITGYEEIYTTSTTTPSEVRYKYYHIPAFFIFFLSLIFIPLILRIILEIIIYFREKRK